MKQRYCSLRSATAVGVFAVLVASAATVSAQVTTYGSGINPPGSLVVTSGIPMVGESFTVGVSNTSSASAPAALALLSLATAPDPAFPAGTMVPGFGLAFPGAQGELLLSLATPNPIATLGPVPWAGGTAAPANFALSAPLVTSLSGLSIYLQGTLVDLAAGPSLGMTNGLQVTLSPPSFPSLVLIQPGTFQMGSDAAGGAPYFGLSNEKPVHQVTISQPFWMGRYEVTEAEYAAVTGVGPFIGADFPAWGVTWHDAVAYCSALNSRQAALGEVPPGYQYRLPTEAEWEYACRAGATTEFHYGPALLCNQARFGYSHHSTPPASCLFSVGSFPVGTHAPNAWGLFDMHGNVWEWCLDTYSPFTVSAKTDPYVSGGPYGVVRGGSWGLDSARCRSAFRFDYLPRDTLDLRIGFRVVLAPIVVH